MGRGCREQPAQQKETPGPNWSRVFWIEVVLAIWREVLGTAAAACASGATWAGATRAGSACAGSGTRARSCGPCAACSTAGSRSGTRATTSARSASSSPARAGPACAGPRVVVAAGSQHQPHQGYPKQSHRFPHSTNRREAACKRACQSRSSIRANLASTAWRNGRMGISNALTTAGGAGSTCGSAERGRLHGRYVQQR